MAKNCKFTGGWIFGIGSAKIRMEGCSFDGTVVKGNYWEHPADLLFRDCKIATKADEAFLRLGVYSVGRIGFDGCGVSGAQSLVDVFDMRPLSLPANADPATNPDLKDGAIALRGIKWKSGAKTVVAHGRETESQKKKITVYDRGNSWPAGVSAVVDLPGAWRTK
jgi:hypothetical protein